MRPAANSTPQPRLSPWLHPHRRWCGSPLPGRLRSRIACQPQPTNGDHAAPLVSDSQRPWFPDWPQLEDSLIRSRVRRLRADLTAALTHLERHCSPSWQGAVVPLERIVDELAWVWSTINHLQDVKGSAGVREAVAAVQADLLDLSLSISQSLPLYEALRGIRSGPDWPTLPPVRRRVVEYELQELELAGVQLKAEVKQRLAAVAQRLTRLATLFACNVRDAAAAGAILVTERAELAGLPPDTLARCARAALERGHAGATADAGPWLLSVEHATFQPTMLHCGDGRTREALFRSYARTAASGATDNATVLLDVLRLRRERAWLLGFESYAALTMSSRMADADTVERLIETLRRAAAAGGAAELAATEAFAAAHGHRGRLAPWDVAFWEERQRRAEFGVSDEQLRPFFPLPQVLTGLFQLCERLFGIEVVRVESGAVPVWDDAVGLFCVREGGEAVGYLFLDLLARPAEKRSGAWMQEAFGRSGAFADASGAPRLPAAHVVLNLTPSASCSAATRRHAHLAGCGPAASADACADAATRTLLSIDEVCTLFHEFGHALQHLLCGHDEGLVAGLRGVEWDALEAVSCFMELWCEDFEAMAACTCHVDTGATLPRELFERAVASRKHGAASRLLRQLHLSALDLELHGAELALNEEEELFACYRRSLGRFCPGAGLPDDRRLCCFSQIVTGGYGAGYYSYVWAQVLAADLFSVFEDAAARGPEEVAAVGRRLRRTVLAVGGGRPQQEAFYEFSGRTVSLRPLLRRLDAPRRGKVRPPTSAAPFAANRVRGCGPGPDAQAAVESAWDKGGVQLRARCEGAWSVSKQP